MAAKKNKEIEDEILHHNEDSLIAGKSSVNYRLAMLQHIMNKEIKRKTEDNLHHEAEYYLQCKLALIAAMKRKKGRGE